MSTSNLGGRLPLLSPADLGPQSRILYDRLIGGRLGATSPFTSKIETGELIGPFNVFLYSPTIGDSFVDFHEAEERATPLSARVREVVILSVGAVWESPYEIYAHRAVASRIGLPPKIVSALAKGETCAGLGADEVTAQRFTLELTRNRSVSPATFMEAETSFGREGLVALAFLAAAYTATCVMLNAFSVPAPVPEQ